MRKYKRRFADSSRSPALFIRHFRPPIHRPRTIGMSLIIKVWFMCSMRVTKDSLIHPRSGDNLTQPRMVQIMGGSVTQLERVSMQIFPQDDINLTFVMNYSSNDSMQRHKYEQECDPLADWYNDHHPSCLLLHEID